MTWPSLADLSRLPIPGTEGPAEVRFTPDGQGLTYLQAEPGSMVRSLWVHDLATGSRALVAGPPPDAAAGRLSREEQLRRERRRTTALGVTEYTWLPRADPQALLLPMGGRAYVSLGDPRGGVRAVAGVDGAIAVSGSPDGRWLAFVRDGDLWVAAMAGGDPTRVSDDAGDGIFSGLAEYAAAEELDRFEGMWWGWDSQSLAYARVDERAIPQVFIPHLGAAHPTQEAHRYPFAGGPNAQVRLRIVRLPDLEATEAALRLPRGGYLARVVARPQGGWLAAVLPRDQRCLRWHEVLVDGTSRELWTEGPEQWINLDRDTRALTDGRILRSTERSGYRHLEVRDASGELLGPLTAGAWTITAVVHVDEARDEAWFMGTRDAVEERHLYRVSLDPSHGPNEPERATSERGWHDAVVDRDGLRWADVWSGLETSPRLEVRDRNGGQIAVVAAPAQSAATLGARPPRLLELTAADGTTRLSAALYAPMARSEAGPPPCVVWVYGGPHAQYVRRAWEVTAHPLRQYLAMAGAAVLVVDNRGSANRGLAFESPLDGHLGSAEVADQAAAVRQLEALGEIDARRVAVTGGSYGGFMTLRAMALEPDLFRAGVAVAPVTDWTGYDTAYTERYLGTPDERPDAYAASSALDLADRIRGSLLVIHGALDENVHLRHSVRLVAALQDLGRHVELVLLPEDRHRTRTESGLRTRDQATVRHLLDALGIPLPAGLDPA